MARAWLTWGPDPDPSRAAGAAVRLVPRVATLEEVADLRHFEQRLAGIIDDVPRKTTANDVSDLLKDAKIRRRPDRDVLARMARLIDQERVQQEIWKVHGRKIVEDWKRSAQGRLAATAAAYLRELKPTIEAA
jgi:hypothetical protein